MSEVHGELHCAACDYDLRGLPEDGKCPECGMSIPESKREHALLNSAVKRSSSEALIAIGLAFLLVAPLYFPISWRLARFSFDPIGGPETAVGIAAGASGVVLATCWFFKARRMTTLKITVVTIVIMLLVCLFIGLSI